MLGDPTAMPSPSATICSIQTLRHPAGIKGCCTARQLCSIWDHRGILPAGLTCGGDGCQIRASPSRMRCSLSGIAHSGFPLPPEAQVCALQCKQLHFSQMGLSPGTLIERQCLLQGAEQESLQLAALWQQLSSSASFCLGSSQTGVLKVGCMLVQSWRLEVNAEPGLVTSMQHLTAEQQQSMHSAVRSCWQERASPGPCHLGPQRIRCAATTPSLCRHCAGQTPSRPTTRSAA